MSDVEQTNGTNLFPAKPSTPGELYGVIWQLSVDVRQAVREVRELTQLMRGDGMNSGLIIEHERIKNRIDYENPKTINERVCEIERIVAQAKWLTMLLVSAVALNILYFLWQLLTHQSAIVPFVATPHP